jgi:hypothetical protein
VALDLRQLLTRLGETLLEAMDFGINSGFGQLTADNGVAGVAKNDDLAAADAAGHGDAAKNFFAFGWGGHLFEK